MRLNLMTALLSGVSYLLRDHFLLRPQSADVRSHGVQPNHAMECLYALEKPCGLRLTPQLSL